MQKPGVVAHTFNPRGRGRQISEFKASLVYKVSSRTARALQRNPVSKNKNKNKKTKTESYAEAGQVLFFSLHQVFSPLSDKASLCRSQSQVQRQSKPRITTVKWCVRINWPVCPHSLAAIYIDIRSVSFEQGKKII